MTSSNDKILLTCGTFKLVFELVGAVSQKTGAPTIVEATIEGATCCGEESK